MNKYFNRFEFLVVYFYLFLIFCFFNFKYIDKINIGKINKSIKSIKSIITDEKKSVENVDKFTLMIN